MEEIYMEDNIKKKDYGIANTMTFIYHLFFMFLSLIIIIVRLGYQFFFPNLTTYHHPLSSSLI